ncbi:double-strand break repair protein AddB [Allosphingosinicella indica]|uniref:double-strand break repair protein AddB n=1 Tax=Allosphingosinicella indica TaxID=941907 RepID=UPI0012F51674|nr:double-strand break repair protein AddB [Allosphingosinicella indica]
MPPVPAVFTIPPHRAFADALAAGLIARARGDTTDLARGLVLVPNNRAVRAITDAFVRRSEGGLLLPRLVPVGDPDIDERLFGALEAMDDTDPIPPAIPPLERLMLLARLVEKQQGVDAAEALRLAEDLARTLDQLHVEKIDPVRLRDVAAGVPDLAHHWLASLERLEVILDLWPRVLAQRGCIDLADRRNRLLERVARKWRDAPPRGFVVAAGITSPAPAIAALLRRISRIDAGMVVLPGLDTTMPADEWDALGPHEPDPVTGFARRAIETHPQFQIKLLLDRMGVNRTEVARWRWGGGRDAPAVRSRAIANAMKPAAFTARWQGLKPADRRLTGVRALELADPAEEAQAIAIALREALETPGRTAALVTPDRGLARRVSAHLKRWGVEADDSAGRPLSQTPPGTLLLSIAAAGADRFAPVPLLALLKHPLVMRGDRRAAWLDGARTLDRALRGPRPPAGLDGITRFLSDRSGRDRDLRAAALAWWREALPLLQPIESDFAGEALSLPAALDALRKATEALAGDDAWTGPAGRSAADLFAELQDVTAAGPERVSAANLVPLLEALLDRVAVRPPYGQHPRLFIWGLIEARLQSADLMILGGLNEGVWPALPPPDPWLAPRIRTELGLPSLERVIGLAAHDLVGGLGGQEVLVTRARRDARSPAVASRFWLRMEAMTGGLRRHPHYRRWAQRIDAPLAPVQIERPAPSPPRAERPRRISVTEVDRLKADPFAFYARRVLGLSPLDPVDADPGPAWRGNAVHAVLEAWMKEDDCDPTQLRPRAEQLLADTAAHPLLKALWEPRLLEAIDWIAERVAADRAAGRLPLKAEARGEAEVAGIALYGIADRIDRLADGSLAIVDYKTGNPPSSKAVGEGYSLQLGLLGLIAERGGFADVEGVPAAFEYWSLAKKAGSIGHVQSPVGGRSGLDPADFTTLAAGHFTAAAEHWLTGNAPFTAKLHPEYAPYADYDQLMRLEEWYGREGAVAPEDGPA